MRARPPARRRPGRAVGARRSPGGRGRPRRPHARCRWPRARGTRAAPRTADRGATPAPAARHTHSECGAHLCVLNSNGMTKGREPSYSKKSAGGVCGKTSLPQWRVFLIFLISPRCTRRCVWSHISASLRVRLPLQPSLQQRECGGRQVCSQYGLGLVCPEIHEDRWALQDSPQGARRVQRSIWQ